MGEVRPLALRAGVAIWLFSWIPFAAIFHVHHPGREIIWIAQFLIGLVGIALAGKVFFAAVKGVGLRKSPRILWSAFLHGRMPMESSSECGSERVT